MAYKGENITNPSVVTPSRERTNTLSRSNRGKFSIPRYRPDVALYTQFMRSLRVH